MSRDPLYDRAEYTGPTFKRLTDEERERVGRKVRALRDKTLLRPDLLDVFELCDAVLFSVTAGRIDVAACPGSRRCSRSTGSRRGRGRLAAALAGEADAVVDRHIESVVVPVRDGGGGSERGGEGESSSHEREGPDAPGSPGERH